jgi:hypothetical protein
VHRLAQEVEARRAEIQASLVRDAPVLAARIARTGTVKEHSEKAVSALFAGRKINIIGEINNILT